jgi:hypothetical protein
MPAQDFLQFVRVGELDRVHCGDPDRNGRMMQTDQSGNVTALRELVVEPAQLLRTEVPGRRAVVLGVQHQDTGLRVLHCVVAPRAPVEVAAAGERFDEGVSIVVVADRKVHGRGDVVEDPPQVGVLPWTASVNEVARHDQAVRLRVEGDGAAQHEFEPQRRPRSGGTAGKVRVTQVDDTHEVLQR